MFNLKIERQENGDYLVKIPFEHSTYSVIRTMASLQEAMDFVSGYFKSIERNA
jgi:hypothetical protein